MAIDYRDAHHGPLDTKQLQNFTEAALSEEDFDGALANLLCNPKFRAQLTETVVHRTTFKQDISAIDLALNLLGAHLERKLTKGERERYKPHMARILIQIAVQLGVQECLAEYR